jgi:hypothetical protein
MSEYADIYFVDWPRNSSKTDRRYDGYLLIPGRNFVCEADSGSSGLYSLPEGRYVASNFQKRTDQAMTRDGVGFSVDLSDKYDPVAKRMRSLLRIHPDGGSPGTAGCIGIASRVAECRDHLKAMLSDPGSSASLLVVRSPDNQLNNLVMALLGSVLAGE